MITETVNKFKKMVGIQPTNQWEENIYKPKHLTLGDMKRFWDNLDEGKLSRISKIKSSK